MAGIFSISGGAQTFVGLGDTPAAYTGAAGQTVRVNALETGLEFAPTSNVLVSNAPPVTPVQGDLWYFDAASTLYIWDATAVAWVGV